MSPLSQIRLNPVLGESLSKQQLLHILKGNLRSHKVVFKMVSDCYRNAGLPVIKEELSELVPFSACVTVVHEAICLQVRTCWYNVVIVIVFWQ